MKIGELLRRYVYVRKCVGCGEILDFEHSDTAFCDMCRLDWNAAIVESCAVCMKPSIECSCMPKRLEKSGALTLRKLFFYHSESSRTPTMSTLYWLKYRKSRRVIAFLGDGLAGLVRKELEALGETAAENAVITNAPRSRKAKREIGYDQSEYLAKSVSRILSLKHERMFSSVSVRQKELGASGRVRNASKNIRMEKDVDVKGKYVVLIDDMVTTGASMAVCVGLLMKAGAAGVLCFSLASKQSVKNR